MSLRVTGVAPIGRKGNSIVGKICIADGGQDFGGLLTGGKRCAGFQQIGFSQIQSDIKRKVLVCGGVLYRFYQSQIAGVETVGSRHGRCLICGEIHQFHVAAGGCQQITGSGLNFPENVGAVGIQVMDGNLALCVCNERLIVEFCFRITGLVQTFDHLRGFQIQVEFGALDRFTLIAGFGERDVCSACGGQIGTYQSGFRVDGQAAFTKADQRLRNVACTVGIKEINVCAYLMAVDFQLYGFFGIQTSKCEGIRTGLRQRDGLPCAGERRDGG